MLRIFQRRDLLLRIFFGFFVGTIAIGMLAYLVPGGPGGSIADSATVVASVDGRDISMDEINRQLQRLAGQQQIPGALKGIYAKQLLEQLIFERMLEVEAKRLGFRVTDEELADRIKRIFPVVYAGGTFIGKDRYAQEVQQRTNMTVLEFENVIRLSLLEEKFRRLVTDGITATPDEVRQEFLRRNEKVKIEYVLLKPENLASGVNPSENELASYFERNKSRYQLGERRFVRYALLDSSQFGARAAVTEQDLRAYYNDHIERYRLQNRAKVSRILFKTLGKTDAEVEETRKKATDVLKQAKAGAKFEELAKKFSEDDSSKDKSGDIGWIVQGQTAPEFEQAAFSLAKGAVSDLVKTQLGFDIIKVMDRETARTQSFEEVRNSIIPILSAEKAERVANELSDQIASAIRRGGNQPIDQLARQFGMTVGEVGPVGAGEAIPQVGGANPELDSALFRLNKGQLSMPIKIPRGYVVVSVKDIQPARQAELADVREKVLGDYRKEKSVELAKNRAEELANRVKSGEAISKAAKALGIEAKTSDAFPRTGSVSGIGSARQLADAFNLNVGQSSPASPIDSSWVVYTVTQREEAKPDEFEKQKKQMEQAVLQRKKSIAFEAFRSALEDRMRKEGKLQVNSQNFKRLVGPA